MPFQSIKYEGVFMKSNNSELEERKQRCMFALVRDVLSDKSVTQVSFETVHGVILVTRARSFKPYKNVSAMGFTANYEDCDDEDDFEEEENEQDEQATVNKFVRWL